MIKKIISILFVELAIAKLYMFAPCYSPLSGRPNFFHVYMFENNVLLFFFILLSFVFYKAYVNGKS